VDRNQGRHPTLANITPSCIYRNLSKPSTIRDTLTEAAHMNTSDAFGPQTWQIFNKKCSGRGGGCPRSIRYSTLCRYGFMTGTHRCGQHAGISGRHRAEECATAAAFQLGLLPKIGLGPPRAFQLIAGRTRLVVPRHLCTEHTPSCNKLLACLEALLRGKGTSGGLFWLSRTLYWPLVYLTSSCCCISLES